MGGIEWGYRIKIKIIPLLSLQYDYSGGIIITV